MEIETYQVPDPCCFRQSSRLGLLRCQYIPLCTQILGPQISRLDSWDCILVTHGLLVCSPSDPESKVESWCQPSYSFLSRAQFGWALAISWSLPLQFCGTRPLARRVSAGAKRKGGVLATQGLREPDKPTKTAVHVFRVFSLELRRVWLLVTKRIHRKRSSRGAKSSRCHGIAGSCRIGGKGKW